MGRGSAAGAAQLLAARDRLRTLAQPSCSSEEQVEEEEEVLLPLLLLLEERLVGLLAVTVRKGKEGRKDGAKEVWREQRKNRNVDLTCLRYNYLDQVIRPLS